MASSNVSKGDIGQPGHAMRFRTRTEIVSGCIRRNSEIRIPGLRVGLLVMISE